MEQNSFNIYSKKNQLLGVEHPREGEEQSYEVTIDYSGSRFLGSIAYLYHLQRKDTNCQFPNKIKSICGFFFFF